MDSKIHPIEHSYFEFKRAVSGLIARYPFVGQKNIGKSVAGRDITALSIGSGAEYTLLLSGDDPTCRITPLILLSFAEELCQKILTGKELCGINIRKAMFGRGILLVPLLNPDGFEICSRGAAGCGYLSNQITRLCDGNFTKWRANLRGVELARNLPINFSERKEAERTAHICGPSFSGFSGYRAESEPETLALTELCRGYNIRHMVHITAFGETVAYSGIPSVPPRSVKMAEVLAAVSSFAVEPPITKQTVDPSDWFTYETGKAGLTVRIGSKRTPEVSELHYWYCRLRELLTLACLF